MELYALVSPIDGAPIYFIPETDSTMAETRALVESGAPHGVVVLTDYQQEGRGRVPGRRWLSPRGESLMCTLALKGPPAPQTMPVKAGVAIARALEELHGLSPAIKWPNDVLVRGRKIAGILCEYSAPWLYVGMGLNLFQERFPREIEESATSIRLEAGIEAGADRRAVRDALLGTILGHLGSDADGWQRIANERLWRHGERAWLTLPDGSRVDGVVRQINDDGTLLLERAGTSLSLAAGELALQPGKGNAS